MNVLMMSLLYPDDMMAEVRQNARDKVQNQINNYQRAFIEGIRANLEAGERLDILNALPVGIFPLQYRKLHIPHGPHDGGTIREIGCWNLPFFKQFGRKRRAAKALNAWIKQDEDNRTVLVYTQYLPYLQALQILKRKYPSLKVCVIVTDLPNELGLPTGRRGLLKRIEYALGKRSLALCAAMDGFALLTAPMAEALHVEHKPSVVIEGLIRLPKDMVHTVQPENIRPVVLYTGTLEAELGIPALLEAFEQLPECDLWLCGTGNMQPLVEKAAERCENIRYFGFVPQEKALELQAQASLLINPRPSSGLFTRYSFPSKTLEYMRSGKPVLCCKLEGIPHDYDPYLCYIQPETADGIRDTVRKLLALPAEQRNAIGIAARCYVLTNKAPAVQCKKLVSLLRKL